MDALRSNVNGVKPFFCWAILLALSVPGLASYAFMDDDKRQDLVPFPRVGRAFWASLEDPSPMDSKRQGLVPFPRVGRNEDAGEMVDSGGIAFWLVPYKRSPMTFTPRIGRRKKRSISAPGNRLGVLGHGTPDLRATRLVPGSFQDRAPWQTVDWGRNGDTSDFDRRQLIPSPRVGKRGGETTIHLRSAFVPRLGRKRSDNSQDYFQDDPEDEELLSSLDQDLYENEKRGAFTPRIGRAPFTPRIGRRSEPGQLRLMGRAFTPRIGRSSDKVVPESKHNIPVTKSK